MMRMRLILILCPLLAAAQPAILVEGARLITGDGDAPVENSAFLIENNKFSRVGKKGQITAPAGAMRVDLTGKTVMPSLVDAILTSAGMSSAPVGWEPTPTQRRT